MARWRGHRPFGSGAKSPDRAVSAGLQRKRGGNQTGASTDRSALRPCGSRTLSDYRNMASVNDKEFVRKFWTRRSRKGSIAPGRCSLEPDISSSHSRHRTPDASRPRKTRPMLTPGPASGIGLTTLRLRVKGPETIIALAMWKTRSYSAAIPTVESFHTVERASLADFVASNARMESLACAVFFARA